MHAMKRTLSLFHTMTLNCMVTHGTPLMKETTRIKHTILCHIHAIRKMLGILDYSIPWPEIFRSKHSGNMTFKNHNKG